LNLGGIGTIVPANEVVGDHMVSFSVLRMKPQR
jgi:hypothetical protein